VLVEPAGQPPPPEVRPLRRVTALRRLDHAQPVALQGARRLAGGDGARRRGAVGLFGRLAVAAAAARRAVAATAAALPGLFLAAKGGDGPGLFFLIGERNTPAFLDALAARVGGRRVRVAVAAAAPAAGVAALADGLEDVKVAVRADDDVVAAGVEGVALPDRH